MSKAAILVLRGDDAFSARLRENGHEVVNLELIRTEPVDDPGELRKKLAKLEDLDGLFFTSPAAAEVFITELDRSGQRFSSKTYVLGERTKRVFERAGISVEFRKDSNTAADMISSFGETEFVGKRYLFVRGDLSMRTIPDLLKGKATVDEAVVYRTVESLPDAEATDHLRKRLRSGDLGWLCIFSPSGVDAGRKVFDLRELAGVRTGVIGQTTGERAAEAGLNVEFISKHANAADFAAGLIEYIKNID